MFTRGPLFLLHPWRRKMFTTIFITPECEICDKYDSLIPHKVLITKQQQLYKMTV